MKIPGLLTFIAAATLCLAPTAPALAADAQELIDSLGCKGCHQIAGNGGALGPALDGVGSRMQEKELRQQLVNPKAKNAASMMPAFDHLPEKDLQALVDYLKGLK